MGGTLFWCGPYGGTLLRHGGGAARRWGIGHTLLEYGLWNL